MAPDPALLLTAVRAHWVLDVAFDEDRCRTRKDHSARGLALICQTSPETAPFAS